MGAQCASNCVRKIDPYPFAPEELERSVAVGEIVRSPENPASFHRKAFSAQNFEKSEKLHLKKK